ncbi:MAG: MarR family winged helix-turn-helix transcriptional regulator [Acidimicrobiales bacterium]
MATTRSTEASEAWRALLVAFTDVHHELAAELEHECGLPIEHYEILLMLYEADGQGLRPSEIATRRRLSRSGATRLIDRLVRDQLVDRRTCGEDRRSNLVSLTTTGRKAFARAGRVHLEGIDRHVGSRLTGSEMAELGRLLEKLALEPPSDGPCSP